MSNEAERLSSGEAWRDWCDRLKAAGEAILAPGFPESARDRAEGFRWLTRLVAFSTQMELEAGDPLHPDFIRYETPHNQWGGPNPDNVYLRAKVDPNHTYRVWANVKQVRQAIFSLNEGDMQLGEFGVYSERSLDQLRVEADGRLELLLSPESQPGNWMPMDPRGRLLTIRIYQSDWEGDAAPVFHIERVGAEGVPRPPLEPATVVQALDRSATWVERSAVFWNRYTQAGWERATPNAVSEARATPGGADNIRYGSCFWELEEDEALLVACDRPDAQYWSFTLHTLGWLESGDFAERQTSLSGHQVHLDDDGRVRIVLAHRDPGVPNWLDVEGRPRGLLVYRWAWARDNPRPTAKVVGVADLGAELPASHPAVSPAERRASLSRRREAAWNRFL
jgi:hypothetical protein